MRLRDRRGYTLMELVIATLIIGLLASFAVPQYLRSVESGKFDDAVAVINQIGTTNRMFALDHGGVYVDGQLTGASCGCTGATCSGYAVPAPPGPFATACALVCCNYLADQNWGAKPYNFYVCDPVSGGGGPCTNPKAVSGATRTGSQIPTYQTWGAWMDVTGTITSVGGAPTPSY